MTHHAKESGLGKRMRSGRAYRLVTEAFETAKRFGVVLSDDPTVPAWQRRPIWDTCQRNRDLGCRDCRGALARMAKRIRAGRAQLSA